MSFEVRPTSSRKEFTDAVFGIGQYFGMPPLTDERYERYKRVLPHDRMFAAWEAGVASRTDEPPHLRLEADALGSAYLGGITFRELADTHRVEEVLPDGIARADVLFQSSVHPWCPEIF